MHVYNIILYVTQAPYFIGYSVLPKDIFFQLSTTCKEPDPANTSTTFLYQAMIQEL